MTCTTLAVCALLDISGTHVTLGPTDHPIAHAEIVMRNALTNSAADKGVYELTYDGISVSVLFDWQRGPNGADALIVTPPDGYTCEPANCEIVVHETYTGTLYLIPYLGM